MFQPYDLAAKPRIDRYTEAYGENSCQHSCAVSLCRFSKYGDEYEERDGWLLTLRRGRCTEGKRVYLFPLGDRSDAEGCRSAVEAVLEDAHSHGALAVFETVTAGAKELLEELYPGRFRMTALRGYYEYIYSYERLAELKGRAFVNKRHDIRTFRELYGDRTEISRIRPEDAGEILAFQEKWLQTKLEEEDNVQLELEDEAVRIALGQFEALGMRGIVVRIGGAVAGYAIGVPLSETGFDVIFEKGDRNILHIYRILNQEFVRRCCGGFQWINREEDVDAEGLRIAKLSYHPEILMEKFLAEEVPG